jgi:hypothetical protein
MEAVDFSETLVSILQTTRRNIPQDINTNFDMFMLCGITVYRWHLRFLSDLFIFRRIKNSLSNAQVASVQNVF